MRICEYCRRDAYEREEQCKGCGAPLPPPDFGVPRNMILSNQTYVGSGFATSTFADSSYRYFGRLEHQKKQKSQLFIVS